MSQELMQKCLDSETLQQCVRRFGYRLHHRYPTLLELEDAENDLWEAIFQAVQYRYSIFIPLIPFAVRAAYSRYGDMTLKRRNRARLLEEQMLTLKDTKLYEDSCFEVVETGYTLDQIERSLKRRASESRQYQFAVRTLELMRKGETLTQSSQTLHVSKTYSYKIFDEVIRECSGKYHE